MNGFEDLDLSSLQNLRVISGFIMIFGSNDSVIPLTSLQVIRGIRLYRGYSLYVGSSADITLLMTSLIGKYNNIIVNAKMTSIEFAGHHVHELVVIRLADDGLITTLR